MQRGLSRETWAEWRPVTSLTPDARNARKHAPNQVSQIAGSLKAFGWRWPVLLDGENVLIAGHGRILAAQKLGWTEAPVLVHADLTETERRAFALADNRLAENATWDEDLLKLELGALRDVGFDLDAVGFDLGDVDKLFASDPQQGLTDENAIPEVAPAISRPGDLWTLGKHRLLCGSSTSAGDVERLLNGVVPHLMDTDPPYGVKYDPSWRKRVGLSGSDRTGVVQNDDKADWREAWALFPGDVAYVWHGGLHSSEVEESLRVSGFEIRAQIIWAKSRFAISRGHYHWQHEPCWYAVRKSATGHWAGDRKQSTLWNISVGDDGDAGEDAETVHGTQKPVECMRRPMLNNSSPGQAVYEPFSGSGTTIIAGETCGRAVYAMELDPAYVDVAVRRWQAFTGKTATLDGRTFADVAAERAPEAAPQEASHVESTEGDGSPAARTDT